MTEDTKPQTVFVHYSGPKQPATLEYHGPRYSWYVTLELGDIDEVIKALTSLKQVHEEVRNHDCARCAGCGHWE